MNKMDLFEKIFNGELTENDVIVEHIKDYNEMYEKYILNDGFKFWYYTGEIVSLNLFKNDNDEYYTTTFSIISKEELEKVMEKQILEKKIINLEIELDTLKRQYSNIKENNYE